MPENSRADLAEKNRLLRERLLKWLPEPGEYQTPIQGFSFFRHDDCASCENCFYDPAVGVVIQGKKRSIVGSQEYFYRPAAFRRFSVQPVEPAATSKTRTIAVPSEPG